MTETPALTAVSIEGWLVLKPPLAADAVVPETAIAIASSGTGERHTSSHGSSFEIGDRIQS